MAEVGGKTNNNNFQVSIGPEVVISGDNRYIPIYVDVRYYATVTAVIKTSRTLTAANPPGIGQIWINSAPTPSNIADFTADSTVYMNNVAGFASVFNTGNVGIGTTNPSQKLDVTGYGKFSSGVMAGDSLFYNSVQLTNSLGGTTQSWMWAGAANQLYLGVGSVSLANTKMVIDNTGNVGIGTTSPAAKLDVSNTLGGIITRSTSPGAAAYTVIPWETQGAYSGNLVITVNANAWAGYTYDIKIGGSGQSIHHAGAFYNNNGISGIIHSIGDGTLTVSNSGQVVIFTIDVTGMTNPFVTFSIGSGGGYQVKPSDVTITIN